MDKFAAPPGFYMMLHFVLFEIKRGRLAILKAKSVKFGAVVVFFVEQGAT